MMRMKNRRMKRRKETKKKMKEKETKTKNPMLRQGDWHGHKGVGAFKSSQQAYDTMHIGDPQQAAKLQSESRK